MLTAEGCRQRRGRLWSATPEDVEWLLVADPRHVCYLSGFWVNPFSFSQGERALLLLYRDGEATLFADNFTRRSAVADPQLVEEQIGRWYDHQHSVQNRDEFLAKLYLEHTATLDPAVGMVEATALPQRYNTKAEKGPRSGLGDLLRGLRREKHDDELALLKQCMAATDAGHAAALEAIRPGMTEFELYMEVQQAAQQEAGCAAIVYGDFRKTNAATPKAGGMPTHDTLAAGDLFILDYSVVIQGYRSDFTNTLAVGTPSAAQQQLYDSCVEALEAAETVATAGVEARSVYAAASRILSGADYGALAHHCGHGLGIGHPEPPILTPQSEDVLRDRDVITIEPGAYVEGVGGVRVEHNYRVKEGGVDRLSNHALVLA